MSAPAQLEARGRELAKRLTDIEADATLSEADKTKAFDALAEDIKAHGEAVNNSERASEFRKSLGDFAAAEGNPDDAEPLPALRCSNLKGLRNRIANQVLRSQGYRDAIKDLGGPAHLMKGTRSEFTRKWEVDLKDSTQAGNTVGEGFFGSGTPAGIGDGTYFLPGAVGPGVLPQFIPGVVEQRLFELTISDLFPSIPATSPVLTYLYEKNLAANAAAVAEGGLYPFSSTQFDRHTEEIGKIANAGEVTDEMIKDAPYLWSFLQTRVLEGVQRQEEVQLLAGGGYPGVNGLLNRAANFTKGQTGITAGANVKFPANGTAGAAMTQANITSLAYGRQAIGSGTGNYPGALAIAETIFSAMVDIQLAIFYSPNVIIMNPLDWETLRLAKDNNQQYYGGSMFGTNYGYAANEGNGYIGSPGNTLWNTRVVQTPIMPRYNILTGYFGMETGFVARREGLSMQMSNQNGTNFTDGMVTIRAEERLGLAVTRPAAFELIVLSPGA